MDVVGVGIDAVDVGRFRTALDRTPRLIQRLFTEAEQELAAGRTDPAKPLAARFAAKEAVLKSLGLGLGSMRFRDIEVLPERSGAPVIVLHRDAARRAAAEGAIRFHVSMTHTEITAQAVVIAM